MRALVFGMMGTGQTTIHNPLASLDTQAMIQAVRHFGADVHVLEDRVHIQGVAGRPGSVEDVIDAKNSGLVLRLMGALAALIPSYTIITGDASIRHRRLALPLLSGLEQLGAFATSSRLDGFAPIIVRGCMQPGVVVLDGEDSQPVSALLIATAFLEGETKIKVLNAGERPWIDLTLSWLDRLQIKYKREGYLLYTLMGGASYEGFHYVVPADFSSMAYPLVAALITGSELILDHLDFIDAQGDKKLIPILQQMGAKIEIEERRVVVKKSRLRGCVIDANDLVDAVPILAVLGCYAEDRLEIRGAAIARKKESDRLSSITQELQKMGAKIEEREDGLIVSPTQLQGASLFSHDDHRIALSLAVAALGAKGGSVINCVDCIHKTYPTFCKDLQKLGAEIA